MTEAVKRNERRDEAIVDEVQFQSRGKTRTKRMSLKKENHQ